MAASTVSLVIDLFCFFLYYILYFYIFIALYLYCIISLSCDIFIMLYSSYNSFYIFLSYYIFFRLIFSCFYFSCVIFVLHCIFITSYFYHIVFLSHFIFLLYILMLKKIIYNSYRTEYILLKLADFQTKTLICILIWILQLSVEYMASEYVLKKSYKNPVINV